MFTAFRNTTNPTLGKPEKEFKREMTNRMEGYRLESTTFRSLSFQGAAVSSASVVSQLPALGGANFPQGVILTNLLFSSNRNLAFSPAVCVKLSVSKTH